MSYKFGFGVKNQYDEHSSIFSIWTTGSDVCLAERSLGGIIKASLHKPGRWQISLTSEYISNKGIPNQSRHFYKWLRTDNISPGFIGFENNNPAE